MQMQRLIMIVVVFLATMGLPSVAVAQANYDVVRTKDGKVRVGKILREVQRGFLFRDSNGETVLIEYEQVEDVQSTQPLNKGSPPAVVPPPGNAVPPPQAPAPSVAPTPPAEAPRSDAVVPASTRTERRARKGLVITGAALLGAGYVIALLTMVGGAAWAAAYPENSCWRWVSQVAWIPLVGPAISMAGQAGLYRGVNRDIRCTSEPLYPVGAALAAIDTLMQFGGLALLIVGLTARETVVVPDEPGATSVTSGVEPYFSLGAPGASLGLTLGARW